MLPFFSPLLLLISVRGLRIRLLGCQSALTLALLLDCLTCREVSLSKGTSAASHVGAPLHYFPFVYQLAFPLIQKIIDSEKKFLLPSMERSHHYDVSTLTCLPGDTKPSVLKIQKILSEGKKTDGKLKLYEPYAKTKKEKRNHLNVEHKQNLSSLRSKTVPITCVPRLTNTKVIFFLSFKTSYSYTSPTSLLFFLYFYLIYTFFERIICSTNSHNY